MHSVESLIRMSAFGLEGEFGIVNISVDGTVLKSSFIPNNRDVYTKRLNECRVIYLLISLPSSLFPIRILSTVQTFLSNSYILFPVLGCQFDLWKD